MGIDTWGVDFVLLDAEDNLVGDAVAYRDSRTAGMYEVADAIMAPEELYRRCGLQRQPFNTIYQLLALQREHPEQLEAADSFLMIPDYLNFLLTGEKAIEYTNASTTGLLNAETGAWDETVMEAFDIPRRLFRNVTHAGACLGPVRPRDRPRPSATTRAWCCRPPMTQGSAYLARARLRFAGGVPFLGYVEPARRGEPAAPSAPRRPSAKTLPTRVATTSAIAF